MIGLPCFERNITICYAVSIQYRNATDNGQISYINIVRQHTDARYTPKEHISSDNRLTNYHAAADWLW